MEWISVKDKLPEHNIPVLIIGKVTTWQWERTQHTGICNQAGNLNEWLSMGKRINEVTHWMPLPNPPKK